MCKKKCNIYENPALYHHFFPLSLFPSASYSLYKFISYFYTSRANVRNNRALVAKN